MNNYCSKGAYLVVSLFFLLFISCTTNSNQPKEATVQEYIQATYKNKVDSIKTHLQQLRGHHSLSNKKESYTQARKLFKELEPIIGYYNIESYKTLNAPNILKIEEEDATNVKVFPAMSFQALEEELYADELNEQRINDISIFLEARLNILQKNTDLSSSKETVLQLIKDAITRIGLTGLTNFDSPVLGQSLKESAQVYQTLEQLLKTTKPNFSSFELYNELQQSFQQSIQLLQTGNFDTFDRYSFIQNQTHHQLNLLNKIADNWQIQLPNTGAINSKANTLFSKETFNQRHFSSVPNKQRSPELIALGKQLFNDKNLSKAKTMSCATCHKKELAFTDGLTISKGQTRNSPTLNYAGLQHGMFADKRAGSLEGQIVSVVQSSTEFHTDAETLVQAVKNSKNYQEPFQQLFAGKITDANIRFSIAEYIRSLAPFDSKFDRNINQQEKTLTKSEIRGFNLFMGKAACATCHFAPTFNGTIPPNFIETEMELLGVPQTAVWQNAQIDDDLGAYNVYGTEERKHFFKTPTLRNISLTAPYMHNGVYETLEDVMKFYNVGGGAGIGINIEGQTLPPDPLDLTDQEIQDIIAFMHTLTDKGLEGN